MSSPRQLATAPSQPDLDATVLADLDLIGKATQTEEDAKKAFIRLENDDLCRALDDQNRRAWRYSKAFDAEYRSVANTFASKMSGSSHQLYHRWDTLVAEHNLLNPWHPLKERRFREIATKMRDMGVLEWKNRTKADLVGPDDPWPMHREWNTSNLYTVHVGLAICHGKLVLHDYNAPGPQPMAEAPRTICQQCQKPFDAKRSDAWHCSSRCRKASSRAADVTDTANGTAEEPQRNRRGAADNSRTNSSLTSPSSSSDNSRGGTDREESVQTSVPPTGYTTPSGMEESVRPSASPDSRATDGAAPDNSTGPVVGHASRSGSQSQPTLDSRSTARVAPAPSRSDPVAPAAAAQPGGQTVPDGPPSIARLLAFRPPILGATADDYRVEHGR